MRGIEKVGSFQPYPRFRGKYSIGCYNRDEHKGGAWTVKYEQFSPFNLEYVFLNFKNC